MIHKNISNPQHKNSTKIEELTGTLRPPPPGPSRRWDGWGCLQIRVRSALRVTLSGNSANDLAGSSAHQVEAHHQQAQRVRVASIGRRGLRCWRRAAAAGRAEQVTAAGSCRLVGQSHMPPATYTNVQPSFRPRAQPTRCAQHVLGCVGVGNHQEGGHRACGTSRGSTAVKTRRWWVVPRPPASSSPAPCKQHAGPQHEKLSLPVGSRYTSPLSTIHKWRRLATTQRPARHTVNFQGNQSYLWAAGTLGRSPASTCTAP